jgi:hypothetical protein
LKPTLRLSWHRLCSKRPRARLTVFKFNALKERVVPQQIQRGGNDTPAKPCAGVHDAQAEGAAAVYGAEPRHGGAEVDRRVNRVAASGDVVRASVWEIKGGV